MTARLITIPVSHFCEKARWALDLAGAPYVEQGWAPVLHRVVLRRLGGRTAPALVTGDGAVLHQSTAIVRHADAQGSLRLFGDDAGQAAEIEALVARFDAAIGPAARVLVYGALLDEPAAFVRTIGAGLPARQRRILRAGRPLIAATIGRVFGVDAAGVRRAEATLEAELAALDEARSGDLLVGGRFSAADLTFAALLAPVVHPPGYGAPVPFLEEMPGAYRDLVARWRATPSGATALDLYARHRHVPRPAGSTRGGAP